MARPDKIPVVCCVCGAIRKSTGTFTLSSARMQFGSLVSHTYCPSCARKTMSRIRRIKRARPPAFGHVPAVHLR